MQGCNACFCYGCANAHCMPCNIMCDCPCGKRYVGPCYFTGMLDKVRVHVWCNDKCSESDIARPRASVSNVRLSQQRAVVCIVVIIAASQSEARDLRDDLTPATTCISLPYPPRAPCPAPPPALYLARRVASRPAKWPRPARRPPVVAGAPAEVMER